MLSSPSRQKAKRRSGAVRPLLVGFALLATGTAMAPAQPSAQPVGQPGGGAAAAGQPAGGGQAQPAPPPLAIEEALTRAYARNPTLQAVHERTRQAEAQARAAGLFPAVIGNVGGHVGMD